MLWARLPYLSFHLQQFLWYLYFNSYVKKRFFHISVSILQIELSVSDIAEGDSE